jgi:glycosyltransferase involved in cell wall biosynthesis
MFFTIIICCFNSANKIVPTLEFLSKLELANFKAELILVDNNCTDNTVLVANSTWNKLNSPFPLKIIYEEKPGLSFARKKGVLAAKGEIIVFCDDDNWLDRGYIIESIKIFHNYPEIGILGGHNLLQTNFKGSLPHFFTSRLNDYAIGAQYYKNGILSLQKKYLWGAGMVIRKSIFLDCFKHYPSFLSDRTGKELASGGDSEICARTLIIGYRLYYNNKMRLYHYIDSTRVDKEYFDRMVEGHAQSLNILNNYWNYLDFFLEGKRSFVVSLLKNLIYLVRSIIGKNKVNIAFYLDQLKTQYNLLFRIPFSLKRIFVLARHLKSYESIGYNN